MATVPKGYLPNGEPAAREVSLRIAGVFANAAALQALPPKFRADGMLAVVQPAALWVFNAASVAAGSATVLVPTTGTGRWLGATIPA
jgi:hypothetical protein